MLLSGLLIPSAQCVRTEQDCKDLVRKLLLKNPTQRLGMGKVAATAIKAHPWFEGFDWGALATKTMTPPYVPKVRSFRVGGQLADRRTPLQHDLLPTSLVIDWAGSDPQVEHAEDASNFDDVGDEPEPPRKRYVSTGVFKDF